MQPAAQLIITLSPDGQIQVNGPIDNKLLCYGMLDSAKDAIRDRLAQQTSEIEIADSGLINRLDGAHNGCAGPHNRVG